MSLAPILAPIKDHADIANDRLINCVQRIRNYCALMAYASGSFSLDSTPLEERSKWSNDFRRLASSTSSTSNQIVSVLSLLSSSLTNAQPLPPYLQLPEPYGFVKKLERIDSDILSVRHIAEPEYSAFAVVQICGSSIVRDVENVVKHVKTLVGEMDFSFHALDPNGTGSASGGSSEGSSVSSGSSGGKAKKV